MAALADAWSAAPVYVTSTRRERTARSPNESLALAHVHGDAGADRRSLESTPSSMRAYTRTSRSASSNGSAFEQHGLDDAEDGRVRANPKRERGDREQREERRAHAERMPKRRSCLRSSNQSRRASATRSSSRSCVHSERTEPRSPRRSSAAARAAAGSIPRATYSRDPLLHMEAISSSTSACGVASNGRGGATVV